MTYFPHDNSSDNSFRFSTKAGTLDSLRQAGIGTCRFCEQVVIDRKGWEKDAGALIEHTLSSLGSVPLAVRSSAAGEDGWGSSHAGANLSLTSVAAGADVLADAVQQVFESYPARSYDDQVLIQPMVGNVVVSGVVLSRNLDTGAPYFTINYDDFSGRTDTVTGGAESKTILVHRSKSSAIRSPRFRRLIESVLELEQRTGTDLLDIEFCIDSNDEIFILQVRPIAAHKNWQTVDDTIIDSAIDRARDTIRARLSPDDGLSGNTTILGEMPDWNPAEMIGTAPHPLASSLYRDLITDSVWAEARRQMAYRHVNAPLMTMLEGRPFIDVRLSFNSFLPADLPEPIARKLVNHQLSVLAANRELHDKIEFAIAITARDFTYADKVVRLRDAGLDIDEQVIFERAVTRVTASCINSGAEGIRRELDQTERLLAPTPDIASKTLADARTYLQDCRRFGTLPFSKLARHGFIAVQLLDSLVQLGVLDLDDRARFMHGIDTVASELLRAMNDVAGGRAEQQAFLNRFGHLRPGTYDIRSWRYDEKPELFLSGAASDTPEVEDPFQPSDRQRRDIDKLLREAGFDLETTGLLDYLASAVKAREQAKFAFSKSISDSLAIIAAWGERHDFCRNDLSFLTVDELFVSVSARSVDIEHLRECISRAREKYLVTRSIRLPHLIIGPEDIDVVRLPLGQPNFITNISVTAPVYVLDGVVADGLDGRILLIEGADPGFDWIFSHRISGLITKFGGANSHMAIRCAEFELPAAIGCGERLFEAMAKARAIELNCSARTLKALQ